MTNFKGYVKPFSSKIRSVFTSLAKNLEKEKMMRSTILLVSLVIATVAIATVFTGGFDASFSVSLRVAALNSSSRLVSWDDWNWGSCWDDDSNWEWKDPVWESPNWEKGWS